VKYYICVLLEVTEKGQEKLDYMCLIEVEIRRRQQSYQSLDGDFAVSSFVYKK
jgi:hypothetical protein